MQKVVGVRFKPAGKIYYFDPENIFLKIGDNVIVETARGMEYGTVSSKVKYVEEEECILPLKPVIRKATKKDTSKHEQNLEKAEEALRICKEEALKQNLDMKLIRAEYTFNASKIIFYFTADGRIDFRELVKNLASIFKIRIELRQIGVRDESKILGGLGPCGCELCCNKWLGDFQPVSIKMAKEQGLSLNPAKISGICGRLLCCLQYEHNCYEDALSRLPKANDRVETPDGKGTVERLNVLKETFLVKIEKDGDIAFKEYSAEDIKIIPKKKACGKGEGCSNCHKKTQEVVTSEEDVIAELLEDEFVMDENKLQKNSENKKKRNNNHKRRNNNKNKNHDKDYNKQENERKNENHSVEKNDSKHGNKNKSNKKYYRNNKKRKPKINNSGGEQNK